MRTPFCLLRANALPETALTIGTVMLIFLGTIRLALTGYEQAEADGASFVAAHAASLDPVVANQQRGVTHAKTDFARVPGSSITVNPDASGAGPNGNGDVIGHAGRPALDLFGSSFVTLNSHVLEPVVGSAAAPNSNITSTANLVNCDTNNQATPTTASCNMTLGAPSPTNSADPYTNYECRLSNYVHLVNHPGPNTQNYFIAPYTANHANGPGGYTYAMDHPWPNNYRIDTSTSINDPHVRGDINHHYLIPPGTDTSGTSYYINQDFTLGTVVAAVYNQGPAYSAAKGYGACP